MSISAARIGAVTRKELTEFRRSRFIVSTMGVVPVIFLIVPTATILSIKASAPSAGLDKGIGFALLYLLLIPVVIPSTIAAYSVVGEREQGTLEPVLTTPVGREEFLIGKAAAILIPAVGIAYVVLGIFLAVVRFGAHPVVAAAVWHSPELLAEVFFIPLLAGWGDLDMPGDLRPSQRRPRRAAARRTGQPAAARPDLAAVAPGDQFDAHTRRLAGRRSAGDRLRRLSGRVEAVRP